MHPDCDDFRNVYAKVQLIFYILIFYRLLLVFKIKSY
jgi:hypothetical protein